MGQSLYSEWGPLAATQVAAVASVRVRVARTEEQLAQVARLRHGSYTRAIPSLADSVREPETADRSGNAVVLLAEHVVTGMPLATVRIEQAGAEPYVPRDLLRLPDSIRVEATTYYCRLAAVGGREGNAARRSMMKAAARYSLAVGRPWILAAAPEGRFRTYRLLGLKPIPGVEPVALPGHPEVLLWLLGGNLFDAERASRDAAQPFLRFVFDPVAPEIEVFQSLAGVWNRPRADGKTIRRAPSLAGAFGLAVV